MIDASISASYGNLKQKGELMLPINRQLDRLYGQKSIFFPKRPSLVLNEKPSLVTSPISYSPTYWATYSRLDRIRRSSLSWILWINHLINLCFHCFFLNGPFPASFSLFSSFRYTVDSKQMFNINKFLLMTGFEPRTSGIGSNRSTN